MDFFTSATQRYFTAVLKGYVSVLVPSSMNETISGTTVSVRNVTSGREVEGSEEGWSYFMTYYDPARFVVETIFAFLAVISNTVALFGIPSANNGRDQSPYHTLFINLAAANVLTSVLQWTCNNILILFGNAIDQSLGLQSLSWCQLFVYLMGATFAQWGFGIVSTLTMMGFARVQFYAVCRPLHHVTIVTRKRVRLFIACSWMLSALGSILPFLVVLLLAKEMDCDQGLLLTLTRIVVAGGNISIGIVALIYLIIVVLCVQIYVEIHRLQLRISQFRFDQHVQSERKAFVTTILLLSTLTVFYLPYTVLYLVSMNTQNTVVMEHGAVILFMSLMPYCKFISDPVIYGMRMREVTEGCLRLALKCGLGNCECLHLHDRLSPANPSVHTAMHPLSSMAMN